MDGEDRRRDLTVLLATAATIFGLSYVAGRASLPTFGDTAAEIIESASVRSGDVADMVGSRAVIMDDLHRERSSRGVPAVIDMAGAIDAHLVLDHADAPTVWRPLQGERPMLGEGFPIDIDVRYSTSDTILRLLAGQAEVGIAQSARLTVVLTIDGRSFVADSGDCSLELGRSGHAPRIIPGIVEVVVPFFDGQILCVDVPDVRTGETISFAAVFSYDDHAH